MLKRTNPFEAHGISLLLRERKLRREMLRDHEQFDAFVISYPKCGRTWHRIMLGFYLTGLLGEDPRRALELDSLCGKAGLKRLVYTHNMSSWIGKLPVSSRLVCSPIEWQGRDVLTLVRDPRDVMVSAYFHVTRRERRFDGTLSEFVRNPAVGIAKLLTVLNRWHDGRHLAASFRATSYEQMLRDPGLVLSEVLRLIGVATIDPVLLQRAVELASFDRMQDYERAGYFSSDALSKRSDDPSAAKVRAGKAGSYKNHLSDDDLAFIDGEIARLGNPFAGLQR